MLSVRVTERAMTLGMCEKECEEERQRQHAGCDVERFEALPRVPAKEHVALARSLALHLVSYPAARSMKVKMLSSTSRLEVRNRVELKHLKRAGAAASPTAAARGQGSSRDDDNAAAVISRTCLR